LELKRPLINKRLTEKYWLRDIFLCIIIEKERQKDFFKFISFIDIMSKRNSEFLKSFNSYIDLLFPWEMLGNEMQMESMVNEYIRMFGDKEKK